jgi:parvin
MSEKKKLEPLIKILVDWMNQELAEKRVIIKDLQEDLYDGQIIQLLFG